MKTPRAQAEMLIRRKVSEVFAAFVEPEKLAQFWLKAASGPLKKQARVEWEFLVPGARETVEVTGFEKNRRIVLKWSDGVSVDLRFHKYAASATRVEVSCSGFRGRAAVEHAIDATQGFAIVLCDLKSLLETGRSGHMVRDKAALIAAE